MEQKTSLYLTAEKKKDLRFKMRTNKVYKLVIHKKGFGSSGQYLWSAKRVLQ